MYVFLNEIAVIGFTALNLLLVKEYLPPKELGIYVSVMKVVVISQNLVIQSLSKSLFPNLAYALHESREKYGLRLRQFRNYLGGFMLLLGLGILLFRNHIVRLLYGAGFEEAGFYLVYTVFLPFFMGMTNIYGWQGLYVMEKERTMAKITLTLGIATLVLLFVILPKYGLDGVLVVRNLHEFLLMVTAAAFLENYG